MEEPVDLAEEWPLRETLRLQKTLLKSIIQAPLMTW